MQAENKSAILWLTENYYPNRGGMAQSCDRIVQSLRNKGLFIGLVHFRSTKNKKKLKAVQNGFYLSFPVDEDAGHAYNILFAFLSNPSLKFRFTHIAAFGGYLPLLGAPILSKLFDIPLVSMLRGNDFDIFLFSAKKRDFLIYALENSSTICTVTRDQKNKVERLFQHTDIQYIPNGINLTDWQAYKSEMDQANKWKLEFVDPNKRIIGIFGHLKPKKGMDFFIDSILLSGNANKVFLLITGEIYPELAGKLESANIDFYLLPFLDRYELLSWYPVCDAVAIPSFYDGMPNVLLEAASLSVPLIASHVGGMKDMLKDEEHGFLFHPADEEDCGRAIRKFVESDDKTLKQIGKNCADLIALHYTDDIESDNYIKIFQK
jgi:glycosyltransferase involved in cell wall biosynthesis